MTSMGEIRSRVPSMPCPVIRRSLGYGTSFVLARIRWVLTVCCLLVANAAVAHSQSTSYLYLDVAGSRIDLRWFVALRDLNEVINLDSDSDGQLTWRELRQQGEALRREFHGNLTVARDGKTCPLAIDESLQVGRIMEENFAVIQARASCDGAANHLTLDYHFLERLNRQHRALVLLGSGPAVTETHALSTGQTLTLALQPVHWFTAFANSVWQGLEHILAGADHVMFVATLILTVMLPHGRTQRSARSSQARLWSLAKLISLFTLAHSITLALSVLGTIQVPTRVFESGIALSIMVMAVNVIRPLFAERWEALLVFLFGLLHGLGFATLLHALNLSRAARTSTLVGFNVGVELGQLLILLVAVPPVCWLYRSRYWSRMAATGGATVIACAGGFWLVERVFDVGLAP